MANIIKPKRSTVAAKVPTTSDIVNGEIAINSTDKKIYTNASGTITQVGAGALTALSDVVVTSPTNGQNLQYNGTNWVNASGGGGGGDVTGAASSTDNAITRFDGTTGKVIQNSTVIVDDTGSVTGVNALTAESLVVNNNATLGSSNTDTLEVKSRITSDLDPNTNNAKDIGSSGRNWRDAFFGRTLHTVNLELTGTTSFDGSQGTSGQVLTSQGTGATPIWTTPSAGAVTSVSGTSPVASSGGATPAISLESGYGDTQNPYASKTENNFLAAPNGTAGAPTFRAIVAADIPTLNQNTTGTASNVTGTVAIANGGTGQTTANAGLNALLPSQTGNSGKVLSTDGTNTSWITSGGGGGSFFSPYIFTATASQTTFAIGVSLDAIQVFINGALQIPSTDYTISGTNVVLTTGAPLDAKVQVNVYTTFDVADTYSTAVIDTNFAAKTTLGDLAYLDTVGTTQIDNTSVTVGKLSATGTPSATTFLRGDGSWAIPSSLLAGQVIETISSVCDGSVVTVQSGSYTIQNVTTQQTFVGATVTDINGSSIDYTPPTGTTRVQYEFQFSSYWVGAHAINDYIFLIDGVEVVFARHNRSAQYLEDRSVFQWTIAIGGTANANTGRQATWTTSKNMKMRFRNYGASNYANLHGTTYWNGTTGNQFSMPHIKITAIA
jgi:hypothetical protein